MSWRLAKSLQTLLRQVNEAAPGRSKISDGTIGDAAHASRDSDHNPWVREVGVGVVTALDITHDPRHGVDGQAIAAALQASADLRIKYIIWNRRIWNPSLSPDWRTYKGANPHDKHIHISVRSEKVRYDDARLWSWGAATPRADAPAAVSRPLLHQGVDGQDAHIAEVKNELIAALRQEPGFGPLMDGLVRGFQKRHGLVADGRIGAYSWAKLDAVTP